jgi:hypothetical protein
MTLSYMISYRRTRVMATNTPEINNDKIQTRFASLENANAKQIFQHQIQRNMIQRLHPTGVCGTCGLVGK